MQRSKTGCAPWGFNAQGHLTQQDPKKNGRGHGELKIFKIGKVVFHGHQCACTIWQGYCMDINHIQCQWYIDILYQKFICILAWSESGVYIPRTTCFTNKMSKKSWSYRFLQNVEFYDRWCRYVAAFIIYGVGPPETTTSETSSLGYVHGYCLFSRVGIAGITLII